MTMAEMPPPAPEAEPEEPTEQSVPGGAGGEGDMSQDKGFMKALKCRECGREYPLEATHVCEFDFGPLEVVYDYDKIKVIGDNYKTIPETAGK